MVCAGLLHHAQKGEVMIKKTMEWEPEFLLSGKSGKRFWKQIHKAKSKKELKDVLLSLVWYVEFLDQRLVELKKHVGDKREY